MLLADLGAEVIKIERPGSGDDSRNWGPPFWRGASTYFAAVNRGKHSLAIDLGSPRGRELVCALGAKADVLIENFRPGVMQRLGLSYEQLAAVNPALIYASINGFGSHGPKAEEAGTEVIVEAETGLMAMMGLPGGPPVRFGVAMVDIATGIALVSGILAALRERDRLGTGRYLEFPLYSTAFSVLATVIASASVDAVGQEGRWGSGHPSIVPYSAFEARDGYVVLGALNEAMWSRLCEALSLDRLRNDWRCATNEARVRNRAVVDAQIARAVGALTVKAVTDCLRGSGVLVAPVQTAAEAITDPQVDVMGLLDVVDGVKFVRTPLAQFNKRTLSAAPALGEHSHDVLARLLDLDGAAVDDLVANGIVQTEEGGASASQVDPLASRGYANT